MGRRKTVFTTGEVAKICNVAPRTVSKWFDAGHLRGYRIPGSKDRRIPVDHLMRFMRAHGIPLNGLETGALRVLVFDTDAAFIRAIRQAFATHEDYELVTAENALEAGAALQEREPHAVFVDVENVGIDSGVLVRFVRTLHASEPIQMIAIGKELGSGRGEALLQAGFDAYLTKPFELSSLVSILNEKTAATVSG